MKVVEDNIQDIKEAIDTGKSIFILLSQNPSFDATASALSLYLSLREAKKNVTIGSSSQMQVEYSRLVGIDKITDKIGNRNLIISFDYKEDSIEKVSYNVEGEKFNLVIQPRAGFPPLDQKSVDFSYEGVDAEIIIIVGSPKLENLGDIYEKNRQAFNDSKVINIDKSAANDKYGQINLVDPGAASISEITFAFIKSTSLPLNEDVAGNLLKGLENQTNNFQAPFTNPDTFEAAAELMRLGAKRSPIMAQMQPRRTWSAGAPSDVQGTIGMTRSGGQTQFSQSQPVLSTREPRLPAQRSASPPQQQFRPPASQSDKGAAANIGQDQFSGEPVLKPGEPIRLQDQSHSATQPSDSNQDNQSGNDQNQNKEEWLKPKIYQGKTRFE